MAGPAACVSPAVVAGCRLGRLRLTARLRWGLLAGPEAGGGSLYVSGVPGTGKTASVLEVMGAAKARMRAGEHPCSCLGTNKKHSHHKCTERPAQLWAPPCGTAHV